MRRARQLWSSRLLQGVRCGAGVLRAVARWPAAGPASASTKATRCPGAEGFAEEQHADQRGADRQHHGEHAGLRRRHMAQALHPQPHGDHAGGDRIEASSKSRWPPARPAKSKRSACHRPSGVTSASPHRLISALMRRGDSLAGQPLADDHVAGLAQHRAQQQQVAPVRDGRRGAPRRPWPAPAARCRPPRSRWPAITRPRMRSPRKMRDSSATAAGMAAMTTPAATRRSQRHAVEHADREQEVAEEALPEQQPAVVRRQRRIAGRAAAPSAAMATAAMPKRSQASRKIGKTATSSLDRPT